MATSFYTSAFTKLLMGSLGNLSTVTIKCAAVSASYVPNVSSDSYYTAISSYVIESVTLTGVSVTSGVLTCNNFTFSGTNAGTAAMLVYYVDTGTAGTSSLIGYDSSASNLPVTFNGSAVVVTVPSAGLIGLSTI